MPGDNLVKATDEELRGRFYYLSHPFTSYGNQEENKKDASEIEIQLFKSKHIRCINPIIRDLGKTYEEAMRKCRILYNVCDAVIMCPGWEKSKGCSEEFNWAKEDHKPIYLFKEGELYKYGASKSS